MVKRYNPVRQGDGVTMITCGIGDGDGKWVSYADYQRLEEELAKLKKKANEQKEIANRAT